MCIIENNDLNRILRNVENPQHTDWEFNKKPWFAQVTWQMVSCDIINLGQQRSNN